MTQKSVLSDLAISLRVSPQPIQKIAAKIDIPEHALIYYGKDKAKLSSDFLATQKNNAPGKLILVTAINPTPAGEGKTTTTIGLHDALCRIGKRSLACLREPSLGPCFGVKGGATGGGYAQVTPMDAINLHFTGDFHAITAAHNLLSAMIDNHLHWGNTLGIDTRHIQWPRVLDLNDRALRHAVIGLGGTPHGIPREENFDITVASELMAILCLAENLQDLERRIARTVVAYNKNGDPVTAADLKAVGAIMALLKDAFLPNLVQTLEHNPVLIHGGPFANIAHGCNSVVATSSALKLADYVVTEAGFGADLGAEKFFNIKCRLANLVPSAAVIVATIRALKMHGGVAKENLGKPDADAVRRGCANLTRHIDNIRQFGVPIAVAVNHFDGDNEEEFAAIRTVAEQHNTPLAHCTHWADGSKGAVDLAEKVIALAEQSNAAFTLLYPDTMPLVEKVRTVANRIYGAADIELSATAAKQFAQLEHAGHGNKPVCIAKTQYSFSADAQLHGAPEGHIIPIREARLAAGAGFVVAICADIMTMPGLPRQPAAERVHLNQEGQIEGLF